MHTQPSTLSKNIDIKTEDSQGQCNYWSEYFYLMFFIFCVQINIQFMPSRFHFLMQECIHKSITGKNISSVKAPIEWRGGAPSKSGQWCDKSNIHLRRREEDPQTFLIETHLAERNHELNWLSEKLSTEQHLISIFLLWNKLCLSSLLAHSAYSLPSDARPCRKNTYVYLSQFISFFHLKRAEK